MEKSEKKPVDFNLHQLYSSISREFSPSLLRDSEWSDGEVESRARTASAVQKSRNTGKYMWLADYMAEGESMGVENAPKSYGFNELQQAYRQLESVGELENEHCVQLLWEIVRVFNRTYRRRSKSENPKVTLDDCKFYVDCILELLRRDGDSMPAIEKMELYREAGMFSKCFEVFKSRFRWADKEIVDELLFRAARGDSSPYIL